MTIICDLDGTLLNIWEKYYYAHVRACEAIDALPGERETYRQYVKEGDHGWGVVREAMKNVRRLKRKDRKRYCETFVQHAETPAALNKDTLIPGAVDFLRNASRDRLFMATSRRNPGLLEAELVQLGIYHYFHDIRSGNKSQKVSWRFKAGLVEDRWLDREERETWFIGDMEDDILAARHLGIKSCAVLSGCRGEKFLRSYTPNRIIAHVGAFPFPTGRSPFYRHR